MKVVVKVKDDAELVRAVEEGVENGVRCWSLRVGSGW